MRAGRETGARAGLPAGLLSPYHPAAETCPPSTRPNDACSGILTPAVVPPTFTRLKGLNASVDEGRGTFSVQLSADLDRAGQVFFALYRCGGEAGRRGAASAPSSWGYFTLRSMQACAACRHAHCPPSSPLSPPSQELLVHSRGPFGGRRRGGRSAAAHHLQV